MITLYGIVDMACINCKFNTKWIFCRSPAKVQKFILPVTDFFMLDVRVRVRVWVRI